MGYAIRVRKGRNNGHTTYIKDIEALKDLADHIQQFILDSEDAIKKDDCLSLAIQLKYLGKVFASMGTAMSPVTPETLKDLTNKYEELGTEAIEELIAELFAS